MVISLIDKANKNVDFICKSFYCLTLEKKRTGLNKYRIGNNSQTSKLYNDFRGSRFWCNMVN